MKAPLIRLPITCRLLAVSDKSPATNAFASPELYCYYHQVKDSIGRSVGDRFRPGVMQDAINIKTPGKIFTDAMYLAMRMWPERPTVLRTESVDGVTFVFESRSGKAEFKNVDTLDFDVFLGLEAWYHGLIANKKN